MNKIMVFLLCVVVSGCLQAEGNGNNLMEPKSKREVSEIKKNFDLIESYSSPELCKGISKYLNENYLGDDNAPRNLIGWKAFFSQQTIKTFNGMSDYFHANDRFSYFDFDHDGDLDTVMREQYSLSTHYSHTLRFLDQGSIENIKTFDMSELKKELYIDTSIYSKEKKYLMSPGGSFSIGASWMDAFLFKGLAYFIALPVEYAGDYSLPTTQGKLLVFSVSSSKPVVTTYTTFANIKHQCLLKSNNEIKVRFE